MHSRNQLSLFQKAKELPNRSVAVTAYRGEAHVFSILFAMLGLCVAGYLYFVGLSILNLVANREAVVKSDTLKSEVATLEGEYFTLAKQISDAGSHLGLVKPVSISYIKADAGGVAANVRAGDL